MCNAYNNFSQNGEGSRKFIIKSRDLNVQFRCKDFFWKQLFYPIYGMIDVYELKTTVMEPIKNLVASYLIKNKTVYSKHRNNKLIISETATDAVY